MRHEECLDLSGEPPKRALAEEQLLRYCKFDTEAMVEIVRFFA